MAVFIAAYGVSKSLIGKNKDDIALWVSCILMVLLFSGYTYGHKIPKLSKKQYMEIPLVKKIDELAWNRTYATYYYKHRLACIPEISDLKSGSRFGELWTLTGLTERINAATNPEEREILKAQMLETVDMISVDMKRYEPSVVLIPQYIDPKTDNPEKNYYDFLMKHDDFRKNMENYTFYDTIIFDTSMAPEGKNIDPTKLIPHDVYVLNRYNRLY